MSPPLRASNEGLLRPRVARAQRTHRSIPPLLADFFSILLGLCVPSETRQHTFDRFLHHRILIFE